MTNETAFGTLIDLALRESDEAARRLGQAVQANAQEQEKLDLLMGYQNDYLTQLGQRLQQGLTAQSHRNYHDFIAGLERAISQQMEVCKNCQQAAASELELWRASERKRLSFQTLEQRQLLAAQRVESRREQKQTDEHAARSRRILH